MIEDIYIFGMTEARQQLTQISERLGDKVVIMSLRKGGRFLLKKVRELEPVKTGRLRRATKVRLSKKNRRRTNGQVGIYININKGRKRDDEKGAFYGNYIDQGYRRGNRQIPGKHFVLTAFEQNKMEALTIILDSIETESQEMLNTRS